FNTSTTSRTTELMFSIAMYVRAAMWGASQRHRVGRKHLGVVGQPEKPVLRYPAERADLVGQLVEPGLGSRVVKVRVEDQGEPEIDVREQRLPHRGSPRSVRRSDQRCRGGPTGPAGIRPGASSRAMVRPAQRRKL